MKVSAIAFAATVMFSTAPAAVYGQTVAPANGQVANAGASSTLPLAKIVPGHSTKADVRSLLGTPWREVQFNDCGVPMDDQGDETWEYRGRDGNGGYRVHIEFSDNGVVHLVGKIPDAVRGGAATDAKVAPADSSKAMAM
jgi:hypothetical protein